MSQPPGPQGPYQQYPGQGQPQGGYPGGQQGPQQGGYPPPGSTGPQGPPPPGPPPGVDPYGDSGKKKSKLPWILGGVGVLVVIGGVIAAILLLGGGGGAGSPTDLADDVVKAMNDRDADKLSDLGCEGSSAESKQKVEEGLNQLDLSKNPNIPPQVKELVKDIKISFTRGKVNETGETATADIATKFDNVPEQLKGQIPSPTLKLQMKDDGGWCATDMGVG